MAILADATRCAIVGDFKSSVRWRASVWSSIDLFVRGGNLTATVINVGRSILSPFRHHGRRGVRDRLRSLFDRPSSDVFFSLSFRTAGYQAVDAICRYYETIHERPVMAQVQPGFLRAALPGTSGPSSRDAQS